MGMECGITFEGWEDFKEGDMIEAFEMIQVNA
jgi:translation initiation factor IF-2